MYNLYYLDTIGAWQKCLLYEDVRFIESPSQNQKSSKVNMKTTIWWKCAEKIKNSAEKRTRSLIFHTAIIINTKTWRIIIKLHFENISIFFKANIHTCQDPPPTVHFCSLFDDPCSLPSLTNILFEWPIILINEFQLKKQSFT